MRIRTLLRTYAEAAVRPFGHTLLQSKYLICSNLEDGDRVTIERAATFTLTPKERLAALCQAVRYIVKNDIPGDIVECGVWKGGSMMAAALTLVDLGRTDRTLRLFDTFEGMSPPTEIDREANTGILASAYLATSQKAANSMNVWAFSPLQDVRENLATTQYPMDRIEFVKGNVEETLPAQAPQTIALLRLDTDWYESTLQELTYLYPRLSVGGVLIVDDYGHWEGARRAVDEYFERNNVRMLLNRIDYAGRIGVKIEANV